MIGPIGQRLMELPLDASTESTATEEEDPQSVELIDRAEDTLAALSPVTLRQAFAALRPLEGAATQGHFSPDLLLMLADLLRVQWAKVVECLGPANMGPLLDELMNDGGWSWWPDEASSDEIQLHVSRQFVQQAAALP
jgi:hypothetical protein